MGFFSQLKKALPYITKGAVIAQKVSDKDVVGAAGATIDLIQNSDDATEDAASADETKALAVAVDDHEARIVAIEADLKKLKSKK